MDRKIMLGALLVWTTLMVSACQQAPLELQADYCAARLAWYPYSAKVNAVQWCEYDEECQARHVYGGGAYNFQTKTIILDHNWPWRGNYLYLTILHEYGHALGLGDNNTTDSIMKQGWDEPLAQGPNIEDFLELARRR